ncbi:hypothetical protein SNEBB_010599 [Seison nebaliae]|nr:hypothetical protein SNEBB_010599 [Seison nebaliae]
MNPSILLYILIHFNFQIIHCNFTNHLKCAVTNVKYPKKFFPDLHENVMKTLGDELRSANNYWLTVLSLDVVETNKIKHLLPSKKLTKITEQTKLYFHRRRITPIIMKPRNIPSLMECRTYESYELNSSTVSKINGNGPPHYKQYKINKILGKGVQGSVLEVANNGKEYALKVFNSASDFILQLNSLIAYNTMFNQLQIHHLSQGANQIFNLGYKFHGSRSDYNLIEYHQPFCLLMSKLHGKMYMYSEFRYRNFARMTPVKMKRALKVIILVFRQMQLLHFTYNEYSIFRNDKLFSSRTFTSFHGDIHSANIMMVNHKKFGADFPQFIDVGFAVSWLMDNPFKILIDTS